MIYVLWFRHKAHMLCHVDGPPGAVACHSLGLGVYLWFLVFGLGLRHMLRIPCHVGSPPAAAACYGVRSGLGLGVYI